MNLNKGRECAGGERSVGHCSSRYKRSLFLGGEIQKKF